MSTGNGHFNLLARVLHWSMALMIIAMLFIGVTMVASLHLRPVLIDLHRPLGNAIGVLVQLRLYIGRKAGNVFVDGAGHSRMRRRLLDGQSGGGFRTAATQYARCPHERKRSSMPACWHHGVPPFAAITTRTPSRHPGAFTHAGP